MNVFLPADILTLATAKVCYENYKKTHSDTENANAPVKICDGGAGKYSR